MKKMMMSAALFVAALTFAGTVNAQDKNQKKDCCKQKTEQTDQKKDCCKQKKETQSEKKDCCKQKESQSEKKGGCENCKKHTEAKKVDGKTGATEQNQKKDKK